MDERSNREHSRLTKRRLDGLRNKINFYAKLEGIELLFIVHNVEKDSVFSIASSSDIKWIGNALRMVRIGQQQASNIA
jgi:hypothetical protein